MVDKEKFGERHTCPACGCKFYDMRRDPPVCPRCGADASQPKMPVEDLPVDDVEMDEEPVSEDDVMPDAVVPPVESVDEEEEEAE